MFGGTLKTKQAVPLQQPVPALIFIGLSGGDTHGIWEGLITKTFGEFERDKKDSAYYLCSCTATVTDVRAPAQLIGNVPYFAYTVMFLDEAIPVLLARDDERRAEINGLKKHNKIVVEALYGAMRAMVSPEATAKLEELIDLLLKKK